MKIGILLFAGSILAVTHLGGCDRSPEDRSKGGTGPPVTSAPQSEPAARPSSPMAGRTIEDTSITTKVRAALIADKGIKSTDIDVDTEQGTVTLTGRVPDAAQVERAAQVARGVEGVKTVTNKLTVGAS